MATLAILTFRAPNGVLKWRGHLKRRVTYPRHLDFSNVEISYFSFVILLKRPIQLVWICVWIPGRKKKGVLIAIVSVQ